MISYDNIIKSLGINCYRNLPSVFVTSCVLLYRECTMKPLTNACAIHVSNSQPKGCRFNIGLGEPLQSLYLPRSLKIRSYQESTCRSSTHWNIPDTKRIFNGNTTRSLERSWSFESDGIAPGSVASNHSWCVSFTDGRPGSQKLQELSALNPPAGRPNHSTWLYPVGGPVHWWPSSVLPSSSSNPAGAASFTGVMNNLNDSAWIEDTLHYINISDPVKPIVVDSAIR